MFTLNGKVCLFCEQWSNDLLPHYYTLDVTISYLDKTFPIINKDKFM